MFQQNSKNVYEFPKDKKEEEVNYKEVWAFVNKKQFMKSI